MKVFYLISSMGTVYLMYVKFKATYDKNHDTFRVEFLLIPALVLSLLINHEFEVVEVNFRNNFFYIGFKNNHYF
jgi:ER lumen protein retaining receptor